MAQRWDGDEGAQWAAHVEEHDVAARAHHERLLEAAAIRRDEHVLDIGCGNGQTTRDAARAASAGRALGVDLSSPMLARARELARAEGVANAEFVQADVQVHPFEPRTFDVAISRFGVMFFDDPVGAFANVQRALRPGGRTAFVVWQPLTANEWLLELRGAVA